MAVCPAPPALPARGCVRQGWELRVPAPAPGLPVGTQGVMPPRGWCCPAAGPPSPSLCSPQELQPVVRRGWPRLLLHAGSHPPREVRSWWVGWGPGRTQPLASPGAWSGGGEPRGGMGTSSGCSGCPGAGPGEGPAPWCPPLRAAPAVPCPHSKCGTLPPESCFFSLICSLGSFMGKCVALRERDGARSLVPGRERGPGCCRRSGGQGWAWGWGVSIQPCVMGAVSPSRSHPGGAAEVRPRPGARGAVAAQHPGAGHWLALRRRPHHGRQLPGEASPRGRGRFRQRGNMGLAWRLEELRWWQDLGSLCRFVHASTPPGTALPLHVLFAHSSFRARMKQPVWV